MQHDLRPRQARLGEDQRKHVLQLVAISGRPSALVRPDAAQEARRIELIGQPGIDQAIEVRPVGAHLDLAEPLGPGGARRREPGLRVGDRDPRRDRTAPRRGSAPGRTRWRSSPRRRAESRFRRRTPRRGGRRRAPRRRQSPFRPSPANGCPAPGRRRNACGSSRSRARPCWSPRRRSRARNRCAGFRKTSVDPTVSSRILPRLSLGLSSSAISKNGTIAQAPGARSLVAQLQHPHVARQIRRNERDIFHRQVAAPLQEGRDARLVRRLDSRRPRSGTGRSPARPSRRSRGRAHRRSVRAARRSRCRSGRPSGRSGGRCRRRRRFRRRSRPWSPCRVRWPSRAPTAAACDGSDRASCRRAKRRTASGPAAHGSARARGSRRSASADRVPAIGGLPSRRATSSARPDRVVGAPDDELGLGRAAGLERQLRA